MMCDNQLEDLVKHVGNFVNNYTAKVFRERILRQQSLSAITAGMSMVINIRVNGRFAYAYFSTLTLTLAKKCPGFSIFSIFASFFC
jgi:hypothetical protein